MPRAGILICQYVNAWFSADEGCGEPLDIRALTRPLRKTPNMRRVMQIRESARSGQSTLKSRTLEPLFSTLTSPSTIKGSNRASLGGPRLCQNCAKTYLPNASNASVQEIRLKAAIFSQAVLGAEFSVLIRNLGNPDLFVPDSEINQRAVDHENQSILHFDRLTSRFGLVGGAASAGACLPPCRLRFMDERHF